MVEIKKEETSLDAEDYCHDCVYRIRTVDDAHCENRYRCSVFKKYVEKLLNKKEIKNYIEQQIESKRGN